MRERLPKLDLNVTNKCNFRCAHCAFDSGIAKMPELSLEEIETILKDTKELGGERFDITGGEPLLRKDVGEIIKIGKSLGYKIELVTNGCLLSEEKLKRFKMLGLDGIAVSLDGSSPEVYNRIRKKDKATFGIVTRNIRAAKEAGFYTKVNTTVFECNIDDIPNITRLALRLGADEQGIYYFTPVGRGRRSGEQPVEPLKWLEFIRARLKSFQNCGMKISVEFPLAKKTDCISGWGCIADNERSHLQILPDGNVYPCAILASYGMPIANLRQCSIKDIWDDRNLWKNYWAEASEMFKKLSGCCVDFKSSFDIKKYDSKRYCFVCPIRKFKLESVR